MFDELLAPLFTTAWGRRAGLGLSIIMCLLLGAAVLQGFYAGWQDATLSRRAAVSTHHAAATTNQLALLIADIPTWHLFGNAAAMDNSDLPITSLQLHLIGVDKTAPEKFSHVIISEAGQPGKVYQVGDHISSDVIVYAITIDGVILENNGHLEKLPLQRATLEFQGKPKPLLNSQER